MLNVAYSITPEIRTILDDIVELEKEILLHPLSPRQERKFRWFTSIQRVFWMQQPQQTYTKPEIERLLSGDARMGKTLLGQQLLNYRLSIERIFEQWTLNPDNVTTEDIEALALRLDQKIQDPKYVRMDPDELKHLLSYLQSLEKDTPIITAAIAYSQWCMLTHYHAPQPMAFLFSYLFLYKNGWWVRHFLTLEHALIASPREYAHAIQTIAQNGSSGPWLTFFCSAIARELASILEKLRKNTGYVTLPEELFHITPRQQQILSLLDGIESITNRQVQKRFRVSQVTASRDLTALTTLGILLTHGKGRSIYYTKV